MDEKKEYIERGALIDKLKELKEEWGFTFTAEGVEEAMFAVEEEPAADVVEVPEGGLGELSDGYHAFNELYHHRAILFSVICNSIPDKAWKSKLHDTGDMFDGMFIVGIETPEGQATYHYDIEPYWEMFKVKELEKAPKWDGHTPKTAIERISKISADVVDVRYGEWLVDDNNNKTCSICGKEPLYTAGGTSFATTFYRVKSKFCPNCGARMDGERKEQT